MMTWRRLALVVLGVGTGTGLAIYLGTVTPASQAASTVETSLPPAPPYVPAPADASAPPAETSAATHDAAKPAERYASLDPLVTAGPTAIEPQPPVGQIQMPDLSQLKIPDLGEEGGSTSALMKILEQVQDMQGAQGTSQPLVPQPTAPPPPTPSRDDESPRREGHSTITALPDRGEGDHHLMLDIQDEDLRKVLELLSKQGGLNILASNSVQGTVSAVLNDVSVEEALNAILKSTGFVARREGNFLYVGTPQDFQSIDRSQDTIGTRIYRPNYVTANELNQLIMPLLTESIGKSSVTTAAESGIAPNGNESGGDSLAAGDAVLVQDYESVLEQVDQVFAEIDRQPLQVSIEAMILSVRLNDRFEFGINWEFLRNQDTIRFGIGTPLDSFDGEPPFTFGSGLKFAFLDSSLGAFLNALESVGDTNVIASPQLMCLNKQRAEILIGSQLGYISTTITETSTTQSVEFLEVGAQLRLRPFISNDGMIRMEVHPELSTGSVPVRDGFTLPEKEVTQVTTNIMCRDGSTVIIGGLKREDLRVTKTQVPVLGNLPFVGVAFRDKTEEIERREIVVLITPRIICDPLAAEVGDNAAMEFHRRQAIYADHMSPLGKRYLGRKYFRKAQDAWAAGERGKALRFSRWAIQFDPTNRPAIDLAVDVWAGNHSGPHSSKPWSVPGPLPESPLDGAELPGWIFEELEAVPGEGVLHTPAASPAQTAPETLPAPQTPEKP